MKARLAFATVINTNPDVLIVDEVLAVGDVNFKKKCYKRLREMNEDGVTILLVSHSPSMIKGWCHQAMLLKKSVVAIGEPSDVVKVYEKMNAK